MKVNENIKIGKSNSNTINIYTKKYLLNKIAVLCWYSIKYDKTSIDQGINILLYFFITIQHFTLLDTLTISGQNLITY